MDAEVVVDAALFMGMHSSDERVRAACKNFFVTRFPGPVVMSLEQVGRCDDLVWSHPRSIQDAYYPFMDTLHTDMAVHRAGYDEESIRTALELDRLPGLSMAERLLLGLVIRRAAVLCTASPRLRGHPSLPVHPVPSSADTARQPEPSSFSEHLERLYEKSLVLRVDTADL